MPSNNSGGPKSAGAVPGAAPDLDEIRGVADAKATEIYASAYNQSPEAVEFYEFTRTMQAYQSIIATNTTLVLSTDSKGMTPDAKTATGVQR